MKAPNNVVDVNDPDEDAQGEEEEQEEEEEQIRVSKRQRVNGEGDSRASSVQEQDIPRTRIKTLPRDTDGYIPGSIVRIQAKEFRHIRLCKSSIACAIALGLNFPPSILGRASELNSFVKLGTESGYIEIELKAPKGKANYIIRRNLTSKSRGSTFTLNNQSVTAKEITAKVQELNVQVSNLCSFLPQDKVSEFAAMTSQQLLRETQRAAGDERLTAWHDTLINTGRDLRAVQDQVNEEKEHVRLLKERNAAIERDVQRFRERKRIERNIALLQVLIPVEQPDNGRWHKRVAKLKARNAPVNELLSKLEENLKRRESDRDRMKKSTKDNFQKMLSQWQRSEKLDTEADDLQSKIDQLKKDEKDRQRRIKEIERDIEQTRQELAVPVKTENAEDLNHEQRQVNQERASVVERKVAIEAELRRNVDACSERQVRLETARSELKKLDNVLELKLQNMHNWDRDTHAVILWLRKNQQRFKMPILEPPAILVNVPNKAFGDAVEACFNSAQLRTFVAQCQEDLDLFNRLINDSQGQEFGRKVRVTTWFRAQREDQLTPPPMTEAELREEGFDGYALDYVDCPKELHWFLKRELNMHRTAIALRPNIDVNKVMRLVARDVTRSRYGKRAVANMTREIRPAKSLRVVNIDPTVKAGYDQTISTAVQEITLFDEERKELVEKLNAVKQEDQVFEERLGEIRRRRDANRDAQARRARLTGKLDRNEKTLRSLVNQPSIDDQRAELNKKLYNLSQKRVKIIREYLDLVHAVVNEQGECCKKGLETLQISANKTALQAELQRKDEKFQHALLEVPERKVKQESKVLLEQSREVVSRMNPELREEYNEIENKRLEYDKACRAAHQEGQRPPSAEGVDTRSLEELQTELETQKANLELNLMTNPGIVEQYERRKQEIDRTEKSIEERTKKVIKYERSIKTARESWQPALGKLVTSIGEKFSAAFDRIGCAGEIRISPHEEYEKWAIDILVKFRDSEKLQLLTSQRQSGGERSLTTILYLMSLTEEARAPFSLVDEINQGMDNRAERMVHNSMVDVTCKADAAQYFLITPKLLPDLEYHERMKILCVNNGEWLPDERNLGNLMDMVERYVQKKNI
ncbi:hypothetical protein F5887DRAFT_1182074 [Amanita rubescens]|nr:hypothetical protein F5887DRAFT_1182074 [Amanita rubescens]